MQWDSDGYHEEAPGPISQQNQKNKNILMFSVIMQSKVSVGFVS